MQDQEQQLNVSSMEHGHKRSVGLEPQRSQKLPTEPSNLAPRLPFEGTSNTFRHNADRWLLIHENETAWEKLLYGRRTLNTYDCRATVEGCYGIYGLSSATLGLPLHQAQCISTTT